MNNRSLFSSRLGKFSIDREMLEDYPGLVQQILSTVIVVRAEYMFETGKLEYTGISHSFEALPYGQRASQYIPEIIDEQFNRWVKTTGNALNE